MEKHFEDPRKILRRKSLAGDPDKAKKSPNFLEPYKPSEKENVADNKDPQDKQRRKTVTIKADEMPKPPVFEDTDPDIMKFVTRQKRKSYIDNKTGLRSFDGENEGDPDKMTFITRKSIAQGLLNAEEESSNMKLLGNKAANLIKHTGEFDGVNWRTQMKNYFRESARRWPPKMACGFFWTKGYYKDWGDYAQEHSQYFIKSLRDRFKSDDMQDPEHEAIEVVEEVVYERVKKKGTHGRKSVFEGLPLYVPPPPEEPRDSHKK